MKDSLRHPEKYKFFAIGAIGTFMGTLDGSILNVALPTLSADLDCPIDVVVWVSLAYSLTLVSLLMVFGAWTQKRGYAFAYRFAFILFTVGSTLAAISGSVEALIAARVIQAVGASMFQAIGVGLVTVVFAGKDRGKGIGLMTMMVSAGLMVGPPLGGFLLSIWPWQSIFILNIPIGLAGLALTVRHFDSLPTPDRRKKVRLAGSLTLSVALAAGMFGLSQIGRYALLDIHIWGPWMLALAAGVAFLVIESNPKRALLGLSVFRNRQFVTSVGGMFTLFVSLAAVLVLLPFYLEKVKGLSPVDVGLYLIILPVVMFVVAPLSGRLSDRIGYRFLTTLGVITFSVGLLMLRRLDIDTSAEAVKLALLVIGVGVGIFNTPNSSALMGSVTKEQRAVASSVISATRNIGMATGMALAAALFTFFESQYLLTLAPLEAFTSGYRDVILVALVIGALGVPLSIMRHNRATSPRVTDPPAS